MACAVRVKFFEGEAASSVYVSCRSDDDTVTDEVVAERVKILIGEFSRESDTRRAGNSDRRAGFNSRRKYRACNILNSGRNHYIVRTSGEAAYRERARTEEVHIRIYVVACRRDTAGVFGGVDHPRSSVSAIVVLYRDVVVGIFFARATCEDTRYVRASVLRVDLADTYVADYIAAGVGSADDTGHVRFTDNASCKQALLYNGVTEVTVVGVVVRVTEDTADVVTVTGYRADERAARYRAGVVKLAGQTANDTAGVTGAAVTGNKVNVACNVAVLDRDFIGGQTDDTAYPSFVLSVYARVGNFKVVDVCILAGRTEDTYSGFISAVAVDVNTLEHLVVAVEDSGERHSLVTYRDALYRRRFAAPGGGIALVDRDVVCKFEVGACPVNVLCVSSKCLIVFSSLDEVRRR